MWQVTEDFTNIRVLVCGSRDWTDPKPIAAVLTGLWELSGHSLVLIHGAATRGADRLADVLGRSLDLKIKEFPADWEHRPKHLAGPERNVRMLKEGKPDLVYAFKDNFDWSFTKGGTENMVSVAKIGHVPCYVIGRA